MSLKKNTKQRSNLHQATLIRFSSDGRDVYSATPTNLHDHNQPWDLITFLAIAQKLEIDFLPIRWQPALSEVGAGGTAEIRQSLINPQMSFAFKAIKDAEWVDQIEEVERSRAIKARFHALTSEISVLGHSSVREHPNIISLFGICWGLSSSDRVWPVLVFEKTTLGDLWRFVKSDKGKTMTIDTRLKLCADIATAVQDLHQSNIVHGDIKPENVLIFKDDSDMYIAKVADFGYSTIFTGAGAIVMPRSKPWVAPEWEDRCGFTLSDAQKMDAYSFGMLCLWLLLDVSLNDLEIKRELEEDMAAFAHELVESQDTLQAVQRENFNILFSSTLSNDPYNRSQDFDQFISCLRAEGRLGLHPLKKIVTYDVTASAPFSIVSSAWQLYEADIRVRTYITQALEEHLQLTADEQIAFELAFCFRIGFGVARSDRYTIYLKESQRDDQALQNAIELLKSSYSYSQNTTIMELLSRGHLSSPSLHERSSTQEEQDKIIDEARRELSDIQLEIPEDHDLIRLLKSRLASALQARGCWEEAESIQQRLLKNDARAKGLDHEHTLASMADLSLIYKDQGRWEELEELDTLIVEASKKLHGEKHADTLASIANLATTCCHLQEWEKAEKLGKEALKISSEELGPGSSSTLNIMANLASTYSQQGRWNKAAELEIQVVETRKKIFGAEHFSTLVSRNNLAITYSDHGQWKEAEEELTQLETISSKVLGAEHPFTLSLMANLAGTFSVQGRWEEAEKLQVQALEMEERILGAEHPTTLNNKNNLAKTYRDQGRWKEAEKLHVHVKETRKQILGAEHQDTLDSASGLAATYREQGRLKESIDLDIETLNIRQRVLGEDHPDTLLSMGDLACSYWNQGNLEDAEQLELRIMETRVTLFGPEHPDTLTSICNLASTYRHSKRLEEAEKLGLDVLGIREKLFGTEHPDTFTSMVNLASTYWSQERFEEALKLGEQAVKTGSNIFGTEHPHTLTSKASLAQTYHAIGQRAKSIQLMTEVLKQRSILIGADHPETLYTMYLLQEWHTE